MEHAAFSCRSNAQMLPPDPQRAEQLNRPRQGINTSSTIHPNDVSRASARIHAQRYSVIKVAGQRDDPDTITLAQWTISTGNPRILPGKVANALGLGNGNLDVKAIQNISTHIVYGFNVVAGETGQEYLVQLNIPNTHLTTILWKIANTGSIVRTIRIDGETIHRVPQDQYLAEFNETRAYLLDVMRK